MAINKKYDSLNLAKRINKSTDIVTEQGSVINSQQETINVKIEQAKNEN
jgi:hypothetical protein